MTYSSYNTSGDDEARKCGWCNGRGQTLQLVRVACGCYQRCSDFCNGTKQEHQYAACPYCGGSGRGF